jgi:hypothetical protein
MRPNNDEFIRLVQEAIAQGMVPPGNPVSPAGGQKSALRHACDVMGIHRDTGRKIWDKVNAPKPRIRVQATTETDAHFVCYGHRYMLTHGDSLGVKGGDGIIGALGPIMRGAIKTRASEGNMGREYDHILMGHWHQLLWLPGCIVNSSLKGFDEYARLFLRARPEPPQQALWFSHPKRGPTFRVAVQVEDGPVLDDEWLTWLAV